MEQPPLETVTEAGYALQVLLISRDEALTGEIVTQFGADSVVITPDLKGALRKLSYLDCAVAIYDVNDLNSYDRVLELKQSRPSLAIIALCEKDLVSSLTGSPTNNFVFRVMAKPLSAGQFKLAVASAYTEHEQLRRRVAEGGDIFVPSELGRSSGVLALLRDRRRLAVIGSVAVLLICVVAFWLLRSSQQETAAGTTATLSPDEDDVASLLLSQIEEISDLLTFAQTAATNGQLIKPDVGSAVFYYKQVLRLDPYDGDALAGLNDVTDQLIIRAYSLLDANNTVAARSDLDAVDDIRATHPRLAEARAALEQKMTEIEASTREAELATLASQAELAALQAVEREQAMLREIDSAISSGNLISLRAGRAVRLVNDAWSISKTPSPQLVARAEQVAAMIVDSATVALAEQDLQLAETLAAQLANLPLASIKGRGALDAAIAETIRIANAVIEPARRTRMVQPRYPRNASRRGIEGWVHLSFSITPSGDVADIEVVEQVPDATFEEAAKAAVSEWKYRPRTVDGVPAEEPMEVRLQFRL